MRRPGRSTMNPSELSLLTFLAHALVGSPESYKSLLKMAREKPKGRTPEYLRVLDAMEKGFAAKPAPHVKDLRGIAEVLLAGSSASVRAGNMLAGALEELKYSTKPRSV